jgi:hypothetical protein
LRVTLTTPFCCAVSLNASPKLALSTAVLDSTRPRSV